MQLTTEQASILQEEGCFRILAAAGSGKTTTMAQYVKRSLEDKSVAENEIMFITFTRFAAQQIMTRLHRILGRSVQAMTGTFHSVMFRILFMAGFRLPEPKTLYDARMDEGVKFFLEKLEAKDERMSMVLRRFKLLIVDEFQDLDHTQFLFLRLFKVVNPSLRIVAVGDLAQNIYRFRGTSNEFLRTRLEAEVAPGLKTHMLTTNFRSTPAILNLVNTLFESEIQDEHILPMVAPPGVPQGAKPKYFEFAVNPGKGIGEYEELVVKTLLPIILRAKQQEKSVALILPMIKCVSFQIISSMLRHESKSRGFSFDIHQIAKEDETCSTIAFDYNPKDSTAPVQCSTFHSSKGLEWDILAVIDVTDGLYTLRDGEEDCEAHYAEKTNLLYVGLTRAVEELYIFANANFGGRERHFAGLGPRLETVCDVTLWGTETRDPSERVLKPIAVTELVRKFPQHTDLYERAMAVTGHIKRSGENGFMFARENVYTEMKKRNREVAFGAFVDWKLKQEMCSGGTKSVQDCILELMSCYSKTKFFHKRDAYDDLAVRLVKLEIHFINADRKPSAPLENYVIASRYLAMFSGRQFMLVESMRDISDDVEKLIRKTAEKQVKTLRDEYVLSQSRSFYKSGATTEIQAVSAPTSTYQGLPEGFDEFVEEVMEPAVENIRKALSSVGAEDGELRGDVSLESESFILGEADMVTAAAGGVLVEIKCGTTVRAVDLRDAGSCKHLLQVLSYVALGRHGTIPLDVRWACIVNPLTGAWEMYDLATWSREQSAEFMKCLEELRMRG